MNNLTEKFFMLFETAKYVEGKTNNHGQFMLCDDKCRQTMQAKLFFNNSRYDLQTSCSSEKMCIIYIFLIGSGSAFAAWDDVSDDNTTAAGRRNVECARTGITIMFSLDL